MKILVSGNWGRRAIGKYEARHWWHMHSEIFRGKNMMQDLPQARRLNGLYNARI